MFNRSTPPRDPVLDDLLRGAGSNTRLATALLRELMTEFPEHSERLASDIEQHEAEGDRITHDFIHRLRELGPSRSPIDLSDGLRLATSIDDIVDHVEQTAALMVLFAVEATMEQAVELGDILAAAGDRVARALDGFTGGQELGPHLTEIHRLENEGDRVSRAGLAALFAGGIDPMVVIRWKDLYDALEDAIDACEAVAIQIEGILLAQG
ncbi:MAG: DUF47 family protein [Solirubrobacteraceae bacterium]|nr:DUF47 family protein [Solirubrobacteraceae bacterium]